MVQEFINLKQGNISVIEYFLKLTQLARYAPTMVDDSRDRMSKFMLGISEDMVKECRMDMLVKKVDISILMVHAQ